MPLKIIPAGAYTIMSKLSVTQTDNILSPGAQTCVVVVLESSFGVAVAHIDSPFIAAQTVSAMADELHIMGLGTITARMYGGDYGNPLTSSASISNPIYAELNRRKISYSHKDYQLTAGFFMATLTAVFVSSSLGPESRLVALACVGLAYKATDILKAVLPEKWRPGFFGSNIDVCVNISTGAVALEKDNTQNSRMLLSEAKDKLIGSKQWRALEERVLLDPTNPKNESALAMVRL